MRILLAEDDEILSDGISRALSQSGFAIDRVASGLDAYAALEANAFDLAILDLGLPLLDGLDVLKNLRSRGSHVPVLILTARCELEDRVMGLNSGADDYLAKPFDLSELEARIKALIRRSKYGADNEICFGALRFDVNTRSITAQGRPLELSARELAVLETLIQRPGRVVNKEQLMEHLCGWDNDVTLNAIEVYIHRTRKRLEPFGLSIRAIRGLGYLLEEKS